MTAQTGTQEQADDQSHTKSEIHLDVDGRGMATPITHALALGITTILVIGLISTATAYLDHQKTTGEFEQVETIGAELASQLEDAARLGSDSVQSTLRVDQPSSVMSNAYSVRLVDPGDCSLDSNPNACLVVDVSRSGEDLVREFPVNNASNVDVSLTRLDPTTFGIAATRTGGGSTSSGLVSMDRTISIGIAADVDEHAVGEEIDTLNKPPIAKFTFEPPFPDSNRKIEFDASQSRDPDGTIDAYHWIIDGTNASFEGVTYETPSPLDPGNHNVILKVVDENGGVATTTRMITVSGLEYNGDMQNNPSCHSGKCVNVSMTNGWSDQITITHVLIEVPTDIDDLKYNSGAEIWARGNGIVTHRHYDTKSAGGEGDITHLYEGEILSLNNQISLSDGDRAWVTIEGIRGGGTELKNVTVGVRYVKDGVSYRTVITDTATSW